jgi:hypothetical protein
VGGGFFGISGSTSVALSLEHFRSDGTRVATAAVQISEGPFWVGMGLVRLGATGTVAALLRGAFQDQGRVVLVDLTTGRARTIDLDNFSPLRSSNPNAMVTYQRAGVPGLAVNENQARRVLVIDPSTGTADSLDEGAVGSMHYHGLGYDPITGRFLVTDASSNVIWVRGERERGWSHLSAHPETAAPYAIAPFLRGGLLAAGWMAVSGTELTTEVSLVDPHAPRSLPGRLRIGVGPVASFQADSAGRLFAVLPWAGQIVRLDPR